jgi:rfaE bifunctional protein kinase chain/domain
VEPSKKSVLVIGDVMLDMWVYLQSVRTSPESNVPIVQLEEEFKEFGGAGNALRHLVNLSTGSHEFIGVIGNDFAGKNLQEISKSINARSQLFVDDSRETTVKERYFLDRIPLFRHDKESLVGLNNDMESKLFASIQERISSKDSVLLSDYAKGVLSQELIHKVILLANSLKIPIISDPGLGRIQMHAGCHTIKPNAQEWKIFVEQMGSESSALAILFSNGTKSVVVTQGAAGIRLIEKGTDLLSQAVDSGDSIDVTGAGDSVAAALSLLVSPEGFDPSLLPVLNKIGGQTVSRSRTELPSGIDLITTETYKDSIRKL